MSGAASRRRGADAERRVVDYLRRNGYPDARRQLAGDGLQSSDIDGVPGVSIEVKDRADSAWPTWRRQALTAASPLDSVVVVRRTRGNPDVGAWICHITHDRREWHVTTFGELFPAPYIGVPGAPVAP